MYGKTQWMIPDMYWPEITTPGHYVSHEAICVLNAGPRDAHLTVTFYFEDREPIVCGGLLCAAQRTNHMRMDKLAAVPMGVPYAALVCSDEPVVVQYSRLDTTQAENGLVTTIAYPVE